LKQARIAEGFFLRRRILKIWKAKLEERQRLKKLKELDIRRVRACMKGKTYAFMIYSLISDDFITAWSLASEISTPAVYSPGRAANRWTRFFGKSNEPVPLELSLITLQRIKRDALRLWTNRVIEIKLRELEVGQKKAHALTVYVTFCSNRVTSISNFLPALPSKSGRTSVCAMLKTLASWRVTLISNGLVSPYVGVIYLLI
jgi:protein SFI1